MGYYRYIAHTEPSTMLTAYNSCVGIPYVDRRKPYNGVPRSPLEFNVTLRYIKAALVPSQLRDNKFPQGLNFQAHVRINEPPYLDALVVFFNWAG